MAQAKLYIAFLVCVNLCHPLGLAHDLSYDQGLGHILAYDLSHDQGLGHVLTNEETNYKILMSAFEHPFVNSYLCKMLAPSLAPIKFQIVTAVIAVVLFSMLLMLLLALFFCFIMNLDTNHSWSEP